MIVCVWEEKSPIAVHHEIVEIFFKEKKSAIDQDLLNASWKPPLSRPNGTDLYSVWSQHGGDLDEVPGRALDFSPI